MEQTIKINVDCADLDTALEKVKELNAQLEKALELQDKLEGTQGFQLLANPLTFQRLEFGRLMGYWAREKLKSLGIVKASCRNYEKSLLLKRYWTFLTIYQLGAM